MDPQPHATPLARVLVTGGVQWKDASAIEDLLARCRQPSLDAGSSFRVITGTAAGADEMARTWAERERVHLFAEPLGAEPKPEAIAAYNRRMLSMQPELVVAFKEGFSLAVAGDDGRPEGGTEHMCRIASEAGVPVLLNGEQWISGSGPLTSPRAGAIAASEKAARLTAGPSFHVAGTELVCLRGDITKVRAEVIVNAANSSLLGGGGVDGAIHRAAGPRLLEACQAIRAAQGGCDTGEAVITEAGSLSARHVVHTVGPVWNSGRDPEGTDALLAACYSKSLGLAREAGATSIAFPCISTGVYGYPPERAADVAIQAVKGDAERLASIAQVLFVCFDGASFALYRDRLLSESRSSPRP